MVCAPFITAYLSIRSTQSSTALFSEVTRIPNVLIDLKPYDFRLPSEAVGRKVKLNGRVNITGAKKKVDAISVVIID